MNKLTIALASAASLAIAACAEEPAETAAGLGETLSGDGPFTVFAPTNDAFAKIPEATLTELTTNDTETLGNILTYHVVEGNVDAATLTQAITDAGDDGYTITTVNGGTLTATVVDGNVVLTDAAGGTATVTATDVALDAAPISENQAGVNVGTISVIDPDAGDAHVLTVSDDR